MAPVVQEKILRSKSPSRRLKKSANQPIEIRPYIGKSQMFCPVISGAINNES